MKQLSIKEKIKMIEESSSLDDISLSALPNVYGESYYFVSYSHLDYKKVYVDILRLQEAGLNIWYDRGLVAGKSWQDYADEAIAKHACIGVIFYVSENSLASPSIAHEIDYVKNIGKNYLSINLPFKNEDKALSASEMLNRLENIDEANKKIIINTFNEKVIYLNYYDEVEKKVEKITSLEKPSLMNYAPNNDDTCKIISINSIDMKNVSIPSSVIINNITYKVRDIEECAFSNCKYLECIELPPYLENISDRAFFGCKKLQKIELNDSIKHIGRYCFGECYNLSEVDFTYNNVLETIDFGAFADCKNLNSIIIPGSIKNIEYGAFMGCNLKNIQVANKNNFLCQYYVEDGCLIHRYENDEKLKSKRIALNALKHDRLYKTEIIAGVSVGDITLNHLASEVAPFAYKDAKELTSISLNDHIHIINKNSFENCENLNKINFKVLNKITSLTLKLMKFKQELHILSEAFANCISLEDIVFPEYLKSIGMKAFYGCKRIKNIQFIKDNDLEIISDNAFENCSSLKEIIIPKNVKRIGEYAFKNCVNLKRVIFEKDSNVNFIGVGAFANCSSLEEIVLPNNLKLINNEVFENCSSLKEIEIPSSVRTIKNSFNGCTNLAKVVFLRNTKIKSILSIAFTNSASLTIVYPKSLNAWNKIDQFPISSFNKKHKSYYKKMKVKKSQRKKYDAMASKVVSSVKNGAFGIRNKKTNSFASSSNLLQDKHNVVFKK